MEQHKINFIFCLDKCKESLLVINRLGKEYAINIKSITTEKKEMVPEMTVCEVYVLQCSAEEEVFTKFMNDFNYKVLDEVKSIKILV